MQLTPLYAIIHVLQCRDFQHLHQVEDTLALKLLLSYFVEFLFKILGREPWMLGLKMCPKVFAIEESQTLV